MTADTRLIEEVDAALADSLSGDHAGYCAIERTLLRDVREALARLQQQAQQIADLRIAHEAMRRECGELQRERTAAMHALIQPSTAGRQTP